MASRVDLYETMSLKKIIFSLCNRRDGCFETSRNEIFHHRRNSRNFHPRRGLQRHEENEIGRTVSGRK